MKKPKKAWHNEPVEEEEEEGDETDEDEEEEAEENEARGELAVAEKESVHMEKGDSQESPKITGRKSGGPQIPRGPVLRSSCPATEVFLGYPQSGLKR